VNKVVSVPQVFEVEEERDGDDGGDDDDAAAAVDLVFVSLQKLKLVSWS